MKRSTWHVRVGLIVVAWLLAGAAEAIHAYASDRGSWRLVHILLLGAVSNAILIWSTHFATAVLRVPVPNRRGEAVRLGVFNAGALGVVVGAVLREWPVIAAGAILVAAAATAHGVVWWRRMRAALPSRFGATVRYYVAACAAVAPLASLGVAMARHDASEDLHARFELAHILLGLLGWIGLTVVGTLVTLWPTMLRAKIADGAELAARRALPVLCGGLALATGAALAGWPVVAAVGVLGYAVGLALTAVALLDVARRKPPQDFSTWSVAASYAWMVGATVALAWMLARAPHATAAIEEAERLVPALAFGFAAQIVIGALSFLIPVVLGGGPALARATGEVFNVARRTRVVLANVAIACLAFELPANVQTAAGAVLIVLLAFFVVLTGRAVALSRQSHAPSLDAPAAI